jgi:hypothetical protein
LVDGIPFVLPVNGERTPALGAVFTVNATKARQLLPGNELHPLRIWRNRSLLVISVINYQVTDIGKYIEFSIGLACTHGHRAAPPLLPGLLNRLFGTGQYVYDLPVSSEVSVKGGKGIWGMPKHQANLDFVVDDDTVSSQYDDDGQLAMKIEMRRPKGFSLPINVRAANYCQFRGMLMKSYVYFKGRAAWSLFSKGAARLTIGDHPRMQPLKELEISPGPIFTAFLPEITGVLDDYHESWFVTSDMPFADMPEGLESVVNLGRGEEWLPPPHAIDHHGKQEESDA